jgi:hypothetical protein
MARCMIELIIVGVVRCAKGLKLAEAFTQICDK